MSLKTIIGALRRHAGSPAALMHTLRGLRYTRCVSRSSLFDRDWYLREHPEVSPRGLTPAYHYLVLGRPAGADPGPSFCGSEYLALNEEAQKSKLDPLVHYEKYGRAKGLRISSLQPVGADGRADPSWRIPSVAEYRASFADTIEKIKQKVASGERVKALFFVSSPAMFPAAPLFEAMMRDKSFEVRLAAIPDLRKIDPEAGNRLQECISELRRRFPDAEFLQAEPTARGFWPDLISEWGADIVCHPSPYDLSAPQYNPRWCIGRHVLPVHINYGYYRSVYDRATLAGSNYTLFWKAFFECKETLAEYVSASSIKGANAEITGYVKMDALAHASKLPRNGGRKRVLIAPHHSVEGGANGILALSNFFRLADFFLSLPEMFSDIDFVFRPHPFLFPVLSRPEMWGRKKTEEWIGRMKAHKNVIWSDSGDYFPVFASCDACIQDCGSYLVEWFYTGKPCCYILKSHDDIDAKFSPLGKECLARCYLAYDKNAIEKFMREVVVGGRDSMASQREAFQKRIMINYPHAAEAALSSIRRAFGMEEPKA